MKVEFAWWNQSWGKRLLANIHACIGKGSGSSENGAEPTIDIVLQTAAESAAFILEPGFKLEKA